MSGFLCIRSGRGRGCHVLPDPGTVPEQLALPEPDDVDQAEETPCPPSATPSAPAAPASTPTPTDAGTPASASAAPAGTSATSSPPESSPPADPATRGQLTALALAFADHGIGREQRADRLWLCSDHAGRPLTTSAHLTRAEARTLLERLHALPRGSLQRVLTARPGLGRDGPILCTRGRGEISEHDRRMVAEFAEELKRRAHPS